MAIYESRVTHQHVHVDEWIIWIIARLALFPGRYRMGEQLVVDLVLLFLETTWPGNESIVRLACCHEHHTRAPIPAIRCH